MSYPSLDEIMQVQKMLSQMRYLQWINESLFTYQWWILLITLILPWVIWWLIVDKTRIFQILSLGLMISILAAVLDGIGTELGFWDYPNKLLPILPRLYDVDFGILPVIYMLIYQYYPKWKPFIFTMIIVAFLMAFAAEPLLIWLNIYDTHTWKHIYSFPIYILIGVAFKSLIDYISFKSKANR